MSKSELRIVHICNKQYNPVLIGEPSVGSYVTKNCQRGCTKAGSSAYIHIFPLFENFSL